MVYVSVFWLNNFPPTDRVSHAVIPKNMMNVTEDEYKKHYHAEFGKCVQKHKEHDS